MIYTYECPACKHVWDEHMSLAQYEKVGADIPCPHCNTQPVKRKLVPVAFRCRNCSGSTRFQLRDTLDWDDPSQIPELMGTEYDSPAELEQLKEEAGITRKN